MTTWWAVLSAVLSIFGVVAAGAYMRRREWLTEAADGSLMEVTVRLLMPCLNLSVTMQSEALRRSENLVSAPLLGILTLVLSLGCAGLVSSFGHGVSDLDTETKRRTFRFASGIFNYGYIPIPLVALLFDHGTLGVLMVYNVGIEIGFWTLGVMVLTGGLGGQWHKKVLNPPSVAVAIGVALNLTGAARHVPGFVTDAITLMGNAGVPVGVLLVGAMMADHVAHTSWRSGGGMLALACVVRAVLAPAAFVAVAWAFPMSVELRRVLVVQAAMPSAMFSIVVARYYGGDSPMTVRIVLVTSLLALVSVPLWISLGTALLALR